MPYNDPAARRACQAKYRARNRETIRAKRIANAEENRVLGRARYAKNPQAYREYFLKARYGITQQQYDDLLASQNGKCAICETDEFVGPGRRPHIDHDHKTGKIRGLVCVHCNVTLGMARDNPGWLEMAITYLERHALTRASDMK